MKHGRSIVAALLGTALLIGSLSGCGSTEPSGGSDGEYQKINLSMAVNGTDTQIDSLVAHHFADLVEERPGGNVVIDVFSNDTLAGGNSTKGVEYIAVGGSDLGAYATCVLANLEPKMSVATLPWSFTSYQQARQVIDTTGGAYYAKLLEAKGITYLGSFHNGFRQLTNSRQEVRSVEDMKNLKIRVAGSNLLMECYKRWGADATNMNWSETYTALQQKTVEGQENPLPAIDAASVQEVQPYCSLWNANYDCLFFCINGDIYNSLTPEQQEVIDECGKLATDYEREINRAGDDEIMSRWQKENGVTITQNEDMDIDSFKKAVDGIDEWYQKELEDQGYDDAKELIAAFQ